MNKQLIFLIIIIICGAVLYYHFKTPEPINNNTAQDIVKVDSVRQKDSIPIFLPNNSPPIKDTLPGQIATQNTTPYEIVSFAETLIGTPYLYGSTDPQKGFDCSGFITYVFNHFQIKVPRSSIDFTNVGNQINEAEAKPGDIILFTGTDSTEKFVGHMGIVVSNQNSELQFIHSTSGKSYGVTITPFNGYYKGRFVKVIRVFNSL